MSDVSALVVSERNTFEICFHYSCMACSLHIAVYRLRLCVPPSRFVCEGELMVRDRVSQCLDWSKKGAAVRLLEAVGRCAVGRCAGASVDFSSEVSLGTVLDCNEANALCRSEIRFFLNQVIAEW